MIPVFDMQGHRGCRGLMPENTIPAMIRALEMGVTTLEMDAVISKDQQVVLSHEPFLDRRYPPARKAMPFCLETKNSITCTRWSTRRFRVGMLG